MGFRYRRAAPALILALLLGLLAGPAAQAETESLFFPITGHNLSDEQGFLSFWRDHDGERERPCGRRSTPKGGPKAEPNAASRIGPKVARRVARKAGQKGG